MAYDERLAQRLRDVYASLENAHQLDITEKKMFGGLAFMVNGKMTCGVVRDELMVRVGAEQHEKALRRKHVRPMDFTGRPMKAFVFVGPAGFKSRTALHRWVETSVAFVAQLK